MSNRCLRPLIFVIITAFGIGGCRHFDFLKRTPAASVPTSVDEPVLAEVVIADGLLSSRSKRQDTWLLEIQAQLQYAVGALAGMGATVDLDRVEISIDEANVRVDGDSRIIPYAARLLGVWPSALPAVRSIVLPRGGDIATRERFFRTYGEDCQSKASAFPENAYWHVYRPEAVGCPLTSDTLDKTLTVKTSISVRPQFLAGSPDYAALWADRRLTITVLTSSQSDFAETVHQLGEILGTPTASSVADVSFTHPVDGKGDVVARVLWVGDGLMTPEVRAVLAADAAVQDLISYETTASLRQAARTLTAALPSAGAAHRMVHLDGRDSVAYVAQDLVAALGSKSHIVATAWSPRRGPLGVSIKVLTAALMKTSTTFPNLAAELAVTGAKVAAIDVSK